MPQDVNNGPKELPVFPMYINIYMYIYTVYKLPFLPLMVLFSEREDRKQSWGCDWERDRPICNQATCRSTAHGI